MAKQYGMVIDLQKCVGCGACALACKTENNTQGRANGQSYNWADFIYTEEGKFPNTSFSAIPVLCNHCSDAPCVKACPVQPKAMFKTTDGITMHNDERCIGCRRCQKACPYSATDIVKEKAAYSVISANDPKAPPHAASRDSSEMIKGCTASSAETAKVAGGIIPNQHKYTHPDYESMRKQGVVEKCIFCEHRVKQGLVPYCAEACPAKARTFGDLNDAASEPAKLLKKYKPIRLKEEKGTRPNVAYIRDFRGGNKV
jgi:Fe-S-cluster-containing dehydrogenase component